MGIKGGRYKRIREERIVIKVREKGFLVVKEEREGEFCRVGGKESG